jgi:hypothetical protein
MSAEIAQLAEQAAATLAPLVPFLVKAGEGAAGEMGSHLATEAWKKAKQAWARLSPVVAADPRAHAALRDLQADPDDSLLQAQLQAQLRRLLLEDHALAADVYTALPASSQINRSFIGINNQGNVTRSTQTGVVFNERGVPSDGPGRRRPRA